MENVAILLLEWWKWTELLMSHNQDFKVPGSNPTQQRFGTHIWWGFGTHNCYKAINDLKSN